MPRLIFKSPEGLKEWAISVSNASKYDIFTTDSKEIIFIPNVSTRPIKIGYYMCIGHEDPKSIAELINGIMGYPMKIFEIQRIEWDIEKEVGVLVKIEKEEEI